MNKPLVSVIIPVYNGEKYLRATIDSVINQTYSNWELIIVDDGSTDNSSKIAQSYPQVRYIYQHNQGVSVARNTGISIANGEFIGFLDADDIWMENKLETQIDYFLRYPHIGYSVTKQRFFTESEIKIPAWFNQKFLTQDHTGYLASTLIVRKNIFAQVGMFNTKYMCGGEATEWFFRAKDAGIPMISHSETLLLKRIHNDHDTMGQPDTKEIFNIIQASLKRKRAKTTPDQNYNLSQ